MIYVGIALAVVLAVAVICWPTHRSLGEEERLLREYFRKRDRGEW